MRIVQTVRAALPRLVALAAVLLLLPAPVAAQENDDCMMCHEDPDSAPFVETGLLQESVHGEFECIMCHSDLDGAELPHEEDLDRVDCGICHDERMEDHSRSLHGLAQARGDRTAPTCVTCHGDHHILSHLDPKSPVRFENIPMLCGQCHHEGTEVSIRHDIPQDRILENYSQSIHGTGLFEKGLTVTAVCTSCHTSHLILPHTDPDSSIHRNQVGKTCEQCHARIEQVHRKVIEGRLWKEQPEKIPICVDCHSPHKIRKVVYTAGMANQDCIKCHGEPDLTMERDGETISLYVDIDTYATGKHAGTACAQCHTGVTVSKARSCETITEPVDCSICHAERVAEFNASTHGQYLAKGDPDAPHCLDCHKKHATEDRRNPVSPTYPRNVPDLCARCHQEGQKAAVRIETDIDDIVGSYEMSIHGTGLIDSGLVVTATCVSCHTAHSELPPDDPLSSVHPDNVNKTCGACHHGIEKAFESSIHAVQNHPVDFEKELPSCEDCHSSHTISRTDLGDFQVRMMDQCGRCHEVEAETFFDTFHGKVSRLGASGAAACYDCHGTHNILPPANPASTLSRRNVVQTCGECHEGSHRRFAGYLTHATHHDVKKYPYLFFAFWGMTALLVGTMTFAILHTLAWLLRLYLSRDQWKHHKPVKGEKMYRRFNYRQRMLHLTMMLSFFVLSVTGMALKFSYMGWAQWFAGAIGGFQTTGTLHRMAAIVLFAVFFLHLRQVNSHRRENKQSWLGMIFGKNSMMFNKKDLEDFIGSMKWFLGLGPRPRYGRFTYWEKFDYFAVFWGVFIIGSTGLLLWFPEFFTRLLPGWSVNVATIVHSDEALLAVAFIFTVHFFNTHFRPDKFPMDPVIFTGRVPIEEFKADKPEEYEELVRTGKLEEHLFDRFPEPVERGFRIFGFTALAVGLTLIVLIVYSMLFGYQ